MRTPRSNIRKAGRRRSPTSESCRSRRGNSDTPLPGLRGEGQNIFPSLQSLHPCSAPDAIECLLVFNDSNPDTIELLKGNMQPLLRQRKRQLRNYTFGSNISPSHSRRRIPRSNSCCNKAAIETFYSIWINAVIAMSSAKRFSTSCAPLHCKPTENNLGLRSRLFVTELQSPL